MRARVPVLLLLGLVFLASVSVSFGIAYWERENPSYNKCHHSCNNEADAYRHDACHARCNLLKEDREYEPEQHEHPQPHQPHEKEDEREQDEREPSRPFPRPHPPHREHHGQEQEQEQEDEGSESESQRQRNPFLFNSNRFQTLFRNQHGHIRVLQRFDQNSRQLQSLHEYRIIEFRSKPNTLLLPNHNDADFLIIVLSGRAIITLVNPDDRNSYNLERGDVQRIPAGTTYYVVNPDDNKTLRLVTLAIPVNNPRNVQSFFLSSTEEQQSYLEGFSKNILEASYNSEIEEIKSVLFVEKEQRRSEQRQQGGVIVEISKEQIQQLSKHAKSSSKKSVSSEDKPFNLRSLDPIYSNQYGKFYEITPEKNPQLKDLNIYVSNVYIKEGGFMLPHYNSKSPVILVIDEGEANIELVGLSQQQERQQEEQEGPREVRRYRAELSQDDLLVIPASYPVAVNATSNLNFFAFGINAENNQRNFLAGEKDNLLRQLHRQVKDLAFPGSAENVEKLVENQRESYFADAQPQQEGKGRKERQGPLSSILNAFF